MFSRILIAFDGSDGAKAALSMAVSLARRRGTHLCSISVREHVPHYPATIDEVAAEKEELDAHFQALAKEARDYAAADSVHLETIVREGHEVRDIVEFAREGRFDLLVLGSRGHSRIFDWVVGSTSSSIASRARCSVLVVRDSDRSAHRIDLVRRILVGVDGSPLGRLAFQTALDLASRCRASVTGITVREVSALTLPEAPASPYLRQLEAAAREHARTAGINFEHVVRTGHAAQVLGEQAAEVDADVMVLGATGLEHPWSPTTGGTASRLIGEAPCSVLLVRPPQAILHVRDIAVRSVSWVAPDAPLAEVVVLLLRRNVKAVPVLDAHKHVVGIITGGDLLSRGGTDLRLSVTQDLDAATLHERMLVLARSKKTARDVMTRHVRTIEADADLPTAIQTMATHDVKRLPIVGADGEMIGIVSRADVLRALAALPGSIAPPDHPLPAIARSVAEAMTTDVPTVSPDADAEDVLKAVLTSPMRRVVVVAPDRTVVGLVSDRDVLLRASPEVRPWLLRILGAWRAGEAGTVHPPGEPLTARDLLAPALVTIRSEDSLGHAIRLMMQHRIKRLIVVDDARRLLGLVDRADVLRLLAEEPPAGAVRDPGAPGAQPVR
jgi:nucleotide-binding universal stress UspA family protein/CBS-domain-containing membrane protein